MDATSDATFRHALKDKCKAVFAFLTPEDKLAAPTLFSLHLGSVRLHTYSGPDTPHEKALSELQKGAFGQQRAKDLKGLFALAEGNEYETLYLVSLLTCLLIQSHRVSGKAGE